MNTHYISTAIVYPNARIHVGFAWECLGADWLNRSWKALGKDTFFSSGMDEHSINVQKAAEAQSLHPQVYCDQMASDIKRVLKQMGVEPDRFIRTSDTDHIQVVQRLVQKAFDSGDIYRAKYEGHYCESCEAYYTEKDLVDGLCPQHKKAPRWISEENYFFKLSKYQDAILKLFQDRPDFIQPEHRRAEIMHFVQSGLKDFSISRSTFTWGVPLPFDAQHVVYVWFDALINYLTAAGLNAEFEGGSHEFKSRWPAAVHIIGKDISRFHCIYWPAMLMSLGFEIPKRVFAHGFIHIKGDRMSKSSGNVVTPDQVMAVSGADPFRYYLLAENQFAGDGNFNWESLILKNNSDLSNDFGNLVNRTINMSRKYFPETLLQRNKDQLNQSSSIVAEHSAEVRRSFSDLVSELAQAAEHIDPAAYIQACMARSRVLNLYIDRTKPWSLAKATDPECRESLQEVLYILLEGIRWLATALTPVLPFGMPEVFRQLGCGPAPDLKNSIQLLNWGDGRFMPEEPKPIYPRLELPASEGG